MSQPCLSFTTCCAAIARVISHATWFPARQTHPCTRGGTHSVWSHSFTRRRIRSRAGQPWASSLSRLKRAAVCWSARSAPPPAYPIVHPRVEYSSAIAAITFKRVCGLVEGHSRRAAQPAAGSEGLGLRACSGDHAPWWCAQGLRHDLRHPHCRVCDTSATLEYARVP